MAKVAKVKNFNVANGPGIRTAIFFSGCEFYCDGCFNSEIWDFEKGEEYNKGFYKSYIKPTINKHIDGISILGGEPFHPRNREAVLDLCWRFKRDYPDKTIYIWTGYELENLQAENDYIVNSILQTIDVIIDGLFLKEYQQFNLAYRGSANQRILRKKIDF